VAQHIKGAALEPRSGKNQFRKSMASSLLSSPSLSLSSQFSAIIISELLSFLISIDPHHSSASISMQLQRSRQQLLNFPEFIDKFGMTRAITFLIGKILSLFLLKFSELIVPN